MRASRTGPAVAGPPPAALANLVVDLFLEAHKRPPKQIVIDLDATDDFLHGQQEGRFVQGYYSCYCYLPLYVFCGRHLLAAKLRPSNIDASAGAVEEVARIIERIRQAWPRVRILLRADSGFARDELMAWCETHRVDYFFGLARNARLSAEFEADLAAAAAAPAKTGQAARRFREFSYATLDSWRTPRGRQGRALGQRLQSRLHCDQPEQSDRQCKPIGSSAKSAAACGCQHQADHSGLGHKPPAPTPLLNVSSRRCGLPGHHFCPKSSTLWVQPRGQEAAALEAATRRQPV